MSMPTRITSEDEFLRKCRASGDIRRYVKALEPETGVRWFFEECWADWEADKFTTIFKSYRTPEYKDHLLSVEATQSTNKEWAIRTVKKLP